MPLPRRDYLEFLFNNGRGVRTDQIAGANIESVIEDEISGIVRVTGVLADGTPVTHQLDGSLLINAAPDQSPQPVAHTASFTSRRLWWDGVTLKRVARTPGHGVVVSWPEYADANYRGASHYVPDNFVVGQHYYNLDAHNFVYRILQNGVARNIGGTPAGFRGPVRDQAAAERLVSGNGQLFEWSETVYRSSGYVAEANEVFFWESVFGEPNELDQDESENATSDVQGTISGRRLAQAVAAFSPFTDVEKDILDDLSRITFPHPEDDWSIRQTYSARDFFANDRSTFLSLGWDADNRLRALSGDGHVGRLGGHNQGRVYDGSDRLRGGLISGDSWLFMRDSGAASLVERTLVNGGDATASYMLSSHYFSVFADPDSGTLIGLLRRLSATQLEIALFDYDADASTLVSNASFTIESTAIDTALGDDFVPLTDVHRESASGAYQDVSGAILEGDRLYLILTDIRKDDGHTASVLIGFTLAGTPNNRTLTVLAENAVDELPISDELTSGILPLEADELFLARPLSVYRLSPPTGVDVSGKADTDLQNVDDNLTLGEQQAVRDKLAAASQGDLTLAGNAITANQGAIAANANAVTAAAAAAVQAANSPVRANDDPENVAAAASAGTNAAVARRDHVHALPTDDTLEFNPVSGDLGVSIHDVVQHLQESIRYFTNSIDHPADPGGHSAGQMFRTGPFPTTISRVQAQIDVLVGHPSYAARIYHVNSDREVLEFLGESGHFVPLSNNPHSYDFSVDDGIGIPIPESSFIVILFHAVGGVLIPLRTGDEASDSPGKSYQDANRDFNMVHSVVYEHVHPSVGDSTVSHGDDDHIRGNIKIFYDIAYDHGALLGGSKANTDLQNVDEDLTDAEKETVRTRIGAGAEGTSGSAATARVAGVLDITDDDEWVETANYTDTTELVGADRTARYMSWFDGALYLADAAGNVNTRDIGAAITGMARGDGLFVTAEGNNLVSRGAVDLAQLDSTVHGARIAVAVQQDNPTKFWSLVPNVGNTLMAVREATVPADGTIGAESVRHTFTVAAVNAALGDRYFDATSIFTADGNGIVDLHVVSASEFWIIFAGLPLAHDLTTSFTVMIRAEPVQGGSTWQLVADSVQEFARDDGRSFVRLGDGLVYLGLAGGGVARYENRARRAEVYREHQQDGLRRITESERDAGTEDGVREMSPTDVHDMIDTHGGGGGDAGDAAFAREVIFQDSSDRAVVVSNGTPIVLDLDRQPVAGSDLRIEFRENSGSTTTPVNATYLVDPIPADVWLDLDPISSTPTIPDNMMAFILKRPTAQFTTSGLVTYLWVGRTATGQLVMRCGAAVELNLAFRITVREILPSGGGSSQQQSGGGRILRTRSVVAADTLIAANNYGFDLSGDGQIALGRYALNPTPRSDIFDFVATIRVGGRAGFPMRLSREQFDYVGEYDLQDTWPFGGTGGGSWGNVSEIPCAMLYGNHRSEGVVKTQLKPQRQQINWSISGTDPATTILFFFSYNSAGRIDFVEIIVFTDQVVEIEGIHFHYWEDA